MGLMPQAFIDDVVERNDIVDVISKRIKTLKKKGREYEACCPFHDEKTPSFTVSPEKQIYHCFGCGAGSSVIQFVMEHDRVEFREAIEILASNVGLELPKTKEPFKELNPNKKFIPHVLMDASKHFYIALSESDEVKQYLLDRGIHGEIAQRFRIGYAANDLKASLQDDYSNQVMYDAGLLGENKDRIGCYYNFFRNRLMFPVKDHNGKLVAFGGRKLDKDGKASKYLNSRGVMFDKSKVLYGLYEAKQHTKNLKRLIAVEGYMDVVALHQHDITYAVAGMGTSFTEHHLKRCYTTVDDLVICFDGDTAGKKAAKAVIEKVGVYLADGKTISFLFLPGTGKYKELKNKGDKPEEIMHDPDSYVNDNGSDAFISLMDNALGIDEAIVKLAKDGIDNTESINGKNTLIKTVRDLLVDFPESPIKKLIVKAVSKEVGLTVKELDLPRTPSSAGSAVKGGEGALGLSEAFLDQYALVEGSTCVFDRASKTMLKKAEFSAQVGKDRSKAWFDLECKACVTEVEAKGFDSSNPIERYIYLFPTEEVWDVVSRETIPCRALKIALADDYNWWLKSNYRKQIDHNRLVFDPTMKVKEEDGYINKFIGLGFDAAEIPIEDSGRGDRYSGCDAILDLLNHLCNGDKDAINWVTCFLAYPLQHIGAKMDTSLLFHGEIEGSGKTLLFSKIVGVIYGQYFGEFGQAQLDSSWNSWQGERLWGVFDEVVGRKDKYSGTGRLKQMVTSEKIVIERKFRESQIETNYMNTAFLANDDLPFPISPFDRRWFVCWPRSVLTPDQQNNIGREIDNGGIAVFYRYLLDYPLREFDRRTKPPVNDNKQRLIDFGMPGWEIFYREWSIGEIDAPFMTCLAVDLYEVYQEWCVAAGYKRMNRSHFILHIKKRVKHKKIHYRESYKSKDTFYRPFFVVDNENESFDDTNPNHLKREDENQEDWATRCSLFFKSKAKLLAAIGEVVA